MFTFTQWLLSNGGGQTDHSLAFFLQLVCSRVAQQGHPSYEFEFVDGDNAEHAVSAGCANGPLVEFPRFSIWLFNIAMENPPSMEVSSWENHLFLWAMASMAMLVITRGYSNSYHIIHIINIIVP